MVCGAGRVVVLWSVVDCGENREMLARQCKVVCYDWQFGGKVNGIFYAMEGAGRTRSK